MVDKLKEVYNNIDVGYDRIYLYFKNCLEYNDWYHKELINIYLENESLPVENQEEDCHGTQIISYYTDESIDKIDIFNNKLNKILYDKFNNNTTNSNIS